MDALEYIIEKIKEFGKLYAEGETTQTKKNKKKSSCSKHSVKVKKKRSCWHWRQTQWKEVLEIMNQWNRYLKLLKWEERKRAKFQDGRTWVKKAKVWNTSSPTTDGRKETARGNETS